MIYAVTPQKYPQNFIEEIKYKDENDFEWRIARVENGLYVKYFGDSYFKFNNFVCENKEGKMLKVKNTGCIFFADSDFETFADVRNILKNGFTDDIWDTFQDLFQERLSIDDRLTEDEV